MCTTNIVAPLVLIFDLDETLFQAKNNGKKRTLSQSAELALSHSQDGNLSNIPISESRSFSCKAIERKKIKSVLDRVYKLMLESKRLPFPIVIKIITSGNYPEHIIKQIMDKFYSNGDDRFSKNNFPIEYFSCKDLEKIDLFTATIDNETYLVDPRKGLLMEKNFVKWQSELPGLKKYNVYLIDNSIHNVLGVLIEEFGALHYPTTVRERLEGQKFSEESKLVFEILDKLITPFEEERGTTEFS